MIIVRMMIVIVVIIVRVTHDHSGEHHRERYKGRPQMIENDSYLFGVIVVANARTDLGLKIFAVVRYLTASSLSV